MGTLALTTTLDSIGLKDIITFVIEPYGAALSSFNLYRSVLNERRSIVLKLTTDFYTYSKGLGPPVATIEVVDRGQRPVVVKCPQLQLPNKHVMALINVANVQAFPKRLEDSETAAIRMQYDAVADCLRKLGYS
jgi:hypothetical protein